MNTMKRLTSLLLAVCMLVAILPAGMFTASAAVNDVYVYGFAEGARMHSGNNPTKKDANGIATEWPQINFTGSNSNFEILQYYSGSKPEYVSLWRFVRSLTTTTQVIHYGYNHTNTKYGIFLFNGDSKGKTATFEIRVPEDGTYTFGTTYYDYADARPVNVYLTSSTGVMPTTHQNCLITTITPAKTTLGEATHSVTGISIPAGDYYITFETATDWVSGQPRYFPLHSLTLTKTAEATPVSAFKVAIERSNHNVLAVDETVQLTSKVWPQNKVEGYANQTLTWATSNPAVATVDANGLVTATGNGTALITGTSKLGNRVETVSVAVGNKNSMLYAVNEDAKKFMEATFGSTTDLNINSAFADTYAYSTFADWCYTTEVSNRDVTAYTSNHTSPDNSKFGAFLWYATSGNAVTFKVNVEHDGNYIPEVSYFSGYNSKAADVYIYPVKYKDTLIPAECKVLSLVRNGGEKLVATAGNEISLRAGEYYVTINSTSSSGVGNYVYLHHIALLYQKPYSNSTAVGEIILTNTCPKIPANSPKYYQVGLQVFPKNADQKATWQAARGGAYVSADENGWLTGDHAHKGSTVVSVFVDGKEQVTSASTGALLYAFSNVGKAAIAGAAETSYTLDNIDDYSKVTTGDKWAFVEQSDKETTKPIVYQGDTTGLDKYGTFLEFKRNTDGEYIRFKIHVPKTDNYMPEILYRDYGTDNVRMTDVYLAPVNAVNPFDTRILRVRPLRGNTGSDIGVKVEGGASYYIPAGDYYLTFRPTSSSENDIENNVSKARYLPIYHFALVEDSENLSPKTPKAVVITKEHNGPHDPLAVGETLQLSARVVPTWASQVVTWESYNEDVATVDQNGVVTAKKNGVAVITATTKTDARSESVVVQVGDDTQVYAFNEVLKKYMEINGFDNETKKNQINISQEADFTDAAYSWKDTYSVGQGWRWLGGNATASNAYTGDSKKYDTGNDDSNPNFKYGLFLLSHNIDSYAQFEIDVERSGKYTAEVFQYMAKNNTDSSQSSCPVEVYISPIGTATEDLMCETYYVGTTVLKDGELQDNGTYWSYGLDKQHFNADGDNRIHLKQGKYNLVFKVADNVGRYLYLHHFALHREGDYVEPATEKVQITKDGNVTDEVVYLNASNPSVTLGAMVLPYQQNPSVTWTTSDSSIATVANGVVTVSPTATRGTAIITATVGGATDTIRVIVGTTGTYVQQFDFRGAAKGEFAGQMTDGASFNLFGTGFAAGYALSISHGSAPWMLYDTTETDAPYCHYSWGSFRNKEGLFIMNSTADNAMTRFKIKVAEDANYGVVLNITDWAHSRDFEVYLAPAAATCPTDARWKVGSYSITRRRNNYYALDLGERTLYAGEYILSFKAGKVNYKGSNNGYVAIQNMSIFRTGEAFYTIEGAQVRIKGKNQFGKEEEQGLRFISTIYKSEYNVDTAAIKEFGTLLVPEDYLTDTNRDGVKDGFDLIQESPNAIKVVAKNRYVDHQDYVSFTAVITGLKPAHYKKKIVARAYVILNDNGGEDGNGTIIYGDTWTKRSIYEVAENGLARDEAQTDENKKMGETEREALEAIITNAK